jgi:hypothetical protein
MHGRGEKTTQNFGLKRLKERVYLKDLIADGNIKMALEKVAW